jgi:hypothetical protein
MMEKRKIALNFVVFTVDSGQGKKTYAIENSLICQLLPQNRILLIQKIERDLMSSEVVDGKIIDKCFSDDNLKEFLDEGLKAAMGIKGKEPERFALKFLSSEMNRLIFGGLFNRGIKLDVSGKRDLFLISLYRDLLPEGSKISVKRNVIQQATVREAGENIYIEESALSGIEKMLNLLIKKGMIKLPESL